MSKERIFAAVGMAFVLGLVGFFIGQYAPIFGDAGRAAPFSDARSSVAIVHALLAATVGMLVGLAVKPGASPPAGG